MSLARLLTTTGSVDREADDANRYQMRHPLPKFATTKRPISLTPIKTKQEQEKVMQTKLAEQSPSVSANGAEAAAAYPPMGVLSIGVFEKEPAAEESAAETVAVMKSESWFSKLSNIFRRKKAAAPAPAPVQTEWSLDKVKVVRNDLSDVDLDVVFASVETTPPTKKAPAKNEKLVSSAWRRVNPNPQKQDEMVLK